MLATLSTLAPALALQPLQLAGFDLTRLLIAVVAIGVVIFVGRFILSVAWKIVTIAAVVIGLLWLVSNFLP
ncbi:hypothetical protein [Halospeciosus flavus]|uniref:Uncharacterized protein n=1 Tax=Halospeciosus flavus TaxID=3032283 RepID=A0ABD5Z901_9EURY|nr:hypothetical protein [Halospeciosus flavus]